MTFFNKFYVCKTIWFGSEPCFDGNGFFDENLKNKQKFLDTADSTFCDRWICHFEILSLKNSYRADRFAQRNKSPTSGSLYVCFFSNQH